MKNLSSYVESQIGINNSLQRAGRKVQQEIERLLALHQHLWGDKYVDMLKQYENLCQADELLDKLSGNGFHGDWHDKKWSENAGYKEIKWIIEDEEMDDSNDRIKESIPEDLPSINVSVLVNERWDDIVPEFEKTLWIILAIRIKLDGIARILQEDKQNPCNPLHVIHAEANEINKRIRKKRK